MAIYTTLFLSRPEELATGFPGWHIPLPEPVRREFRNPFTGETWVVETREPVWEEAAHEPSGSRAELVTGTGSYEDYLEGRLPEFVRDRPHWATKSLTNIELDALAGAVGSTATLESALYAPPAASAGIEQIPSELLEKLRSLNRSELEPVAERWAEIMSQPEYTHSVSGERVNEDWTLDEALSILGPILDLVQEANHGSQMYLLCEW